MLKILMLISILSIGGLVRVKSIKWELMDTIPSDSFLKIYLFNLTNPDEFENGDKPNFNEVGPYVFREIREKIGIEYLNNGSIVEFSERKTYEFLRNESVGSDEDRVNIVNIPLLTFGKILSEVTYVGPNFFKSLVKSGEKLSRRNERVGDVFYYGFEAGVYVKVLEALQNDQPIPPQFSGGRFGLFKGRNGSDDGKYEIGTGIDPNFPFGKIIKWKGLESLNWWKDASCNQINGNLPTLFDPITLSKAHLNTFDPDVCRLLRYTYSGKKIFEEISSWKYVISKEFLENPRVDKDNMCYCVHPENDGEKCYKKGVMDLGPCRNGAPLILSYPHFYHGDESYINGVNGMNPNKTLHNSLILIEPKTGTVLQEIKRFQLNIHMKPFPNLLYLKKVQNLLLPVFWSEKIYSLNEEGLKILKEELQNHPQDDVDEDGSWEGGIHLTTTPPNISKSLDLNSNGSTKILLNTIGFLINIIIILTLK